MRFLLFCNILSWNKLREIRMDKVKGQCPECKGLFKAQPEWAGMKAQCPHCKAMIVVQLIEEAASSTIDLHKPSPPPPPVPGGQSGHGVSASGDYPPPPVPGGCPPPPRLVTGGCPPPSVPPYVHAEDSSQPTSRQGRAIQAPPPPVAVPPNGYADGQQYPCPAQETLVESSQYGRNPGIFYWFIKCFKKYFTFSGRARRAEYWSFALGNFLVCIAIHYAIGMLAVDDVVYVSETVDKLYGFIIFFPGVAVTVRRLHDIGKSGWNFLWAFVPLIGWLVLLCFEVRAGEAGPNEYGEDPKVSPEI